MGNSSDVQAKSTITREADVAQAIISRITREVHTILGEIKKVNTTRNIEKVKSEFAQIIFGDEGNEGDLDHGALKEVTDRGAACGNPGAAKKGEHAGNNLVVDFFCLCAMTIGAEGIENVCGVYVGGKGGKSKPDKHGWDEKNSPLGSSAMWASIKKGCRNLMHQHPKSTEEGKEILGDYVKHLKSGGVYRWDSGKQSERKRGMLGTGVVTNDGSEKGPACNGKKGSGRGQPPAGICVYYGLDNWDHNIDWLNRFKTALAMVDALNNKTANIQRDIEKLHMLLHRAEEIYETTNVISKVQNPVIPTSLQTAAKRLTAYNAAWRHPRYAHFLAPWVILLL
ncbi:unnamed protein product [Trypanosoma congolense IL3000]|uniref:WGS project CAEQ00000000 data, annotated contig 479 n=1 Tax=Trypanosoma congolense (strain IL3000) TaxID=1068625 RepID=F9WG90_TRYCI|nr:unnamed protein product [Trypanosoma congolense IL3000]